MAATFDTEEQGERRPHDVFLSYNSADRDRVTAIKDLLSRRGVRAFLDRDDLVAGLPWPQALERALRSVRAVLVFVGGADGGESLGLWQRREAWFALDHQAQREGEGKSFPVIPVLLPGARPDAGFLLLNTWVDVREAPNESAAVEAIAKAVSQYSARPPEAVPLTVCPYRALEAFREEHAALFFGRESFANGLLERVVHRPLVALVGPSGSGKSSVVQAGLVPLLRRQRPPERAWDIVVFRPGDEPFHRLATSLVPLLESDADEVDRLALARKLGEKLTDGTVRLEDVIDRLLTKSNGTDRLLVVADQFEELFTLTPPPQRRPFVNTVLDALERASVTLVIALRADFYGHAIAADRRLSDHIQSGIVNLAPMTRLELRRAVEQPARRAAIHFEAGLVDRILDHFELQPGGLPLLEFALTQLWERRDGQRITHTAYDAIGEIAGAIGRRAETVFLTLDGQQQRSALSLFTRLVRVAASKDTEPDTRRRVEVDALNDLERSVLQRFVDARLLVLNRGNAADEHTVELAHEALIQGWTRLVECVDQQREFLLWRQRLGQSVAEWHHTRRNASVLLRGPALKEAVSWVRSRNADLSQAEHEFVRRSRKKHQHRRRWLSAAIGFAVLILGAIPALRFVTRTNPAVVWISTRIIGPAMLPDATPSVTAGWIHAMDVAGRLEELGTETVFSRPVNRLITLQAAAFLMAHHGRTADATRLADRALAVARELPDFDSSAGVQLDMAAVLNAAGREETARTMALRALALGRQEQSSEIRLRIVADAALALGRVGLKREASLAVDEVRAALATIRAPAPRAELGDRIARALVQLGEVDQAMALLIDLGREWRLSGSFVQLLIDRGYLKQAHDLVTASDDPLVAAVLASALVSAGHPDEAKAMTRAALARLETEAWAPDSRDAARADFYELLLEVMSANEAVSLIREHGSPDELASLAVALARGSHSDLVFELAQDAARRAERLYDVQDRDRLMVKVTEALATGGRTDRALTTARAIEDRERRAAALAHAAYGFASEGRNDEAEELIGDVAKVLPSMRYPGEQSAVWATVSITRIRLGDYAAVYGREATALSFFEDSEGIDPSPSDVLRVVTWIIRDAAVRRNGALRDVFAAGPAKGLGRYNVDWP